MVTTSVSVRRAAHGETMAVLARWGLAARATVYLLIGVLAVALAFGSRSGETDQRGAFQELTRHTGGTLLVWLVGFGLAGYALWRLSEAAFGVVGEGKKAGPRVQSFARACIYGFFAASAFKVASDSGSSSQAHQQQTLTARTMQHSGGRWAVGIVGAIIVICGLVLIWEGIKRKFEKYLDMGRMSPTTRKVVEFLGVVGSVSRGVVFGLAGVFVIAAAVDFNPHKARGLDRALRELADTSAGPWLLVAVAIGLIMFGVYGFAEAKWRRTT
jgi:Domain of Unknown Function (DUF1206)